MPKSNANKLPAPALPAAPEPPHQEKYLGLREPRDTPQKLRLLRLPRDSQRFPKIFKATQIFPDAAAPAPAPAPPAGPKVRKLVLLNVPNVPNGRFAAMREALCEDQNESYVNDGGFWVPPAPPEVVEVFEMFEEVERGLVNMLNEGIVESDADADAEDDDDDDTKGDEETPEDSDADSDEEETEEKEEAAEEADGEETEAGTWAPQSSSGTSGILGILGCLGKGPNPGIPPGL
ncbi:hypothetical protein FB446DRAFT_826596 [Lentinula raphanica]|nr:hypothetical protein FB446DRAFT_826596 [Lentinula raphanica]